MRKSQPTQGEQTGFANSTEDQNAANGAFGKAAGSISNAEGTIGEAKSTLGASQPFLRSLTNVDSGGFTQSGRAQLNASRDATNEGYDNAQSANRLRANMSGFGYEQPVTQGGESAVDVQRGSALAKIPAQVLQQQNETGLQATGQENQQAGIQEGLAGLQNQQGGLYNQQGSSELSAADNSLNTGATAENGRLARRGSFLQGLGGALGGIAGGFLNPLGTALGKRAGG